jgi:hypothetical protein
MNKKNPEQIGSGSFNYLLNLGRVTSVSGGKKTKQNKQNTTIATPRGLYINIFLTCPFVQLTKKSTCPTQSFSCPKKLIKITKTRE